LSIYAKSPWLELLVGSLLLRLKPIAFILVLLPASLWAAAPVLHLSVEGSPCPSATQTRHALEQRLGRRVTLEPGKPSVRIRLSSSGRLIVSLVSGTGEPAVEKTVSVRPGECNEVPETVALLVEAWLERLPSLGEALVAVAPPPVHKPQPAQSTKPVEEKPVEEIPPEAEQPKPPPPPPAEAPSVATPPAAEVPFSAPKLKLGLLAGASIATTLRQASFHALTQADFNLRGPWGVCALLGLEPSIRSAVGRGTVSASVSSLALMGRFSLPAARRFGLDLLAGVGWNDLPSKAKAITSTTRLRYWTSACGRGPSGGSQLPVRCLLWGSYRTPAVSRRIL